MGLLSIFSNVDDNFYYVDPTTGVQVTARSPAEAEALSSLNPGLMPRADLGTDQRLADSGMRSNGERIDGGTALGNIRGDYGRVPGTNVASQPTIGDRFRSLLFG